MNYKTTALLLISSLFLGGCGTVGGLASDVSGVFDFGGPPPLPADGSSTASALSYWVIGGFAIAIVGIIGLVTPFKNSAVIVIASGAGCAFFGYALEQYAHYAVIAGIVAGMSYGAWYLGHKDARKNYDDGYNLGFERGKDFEPTTEQ